MAHKRGSHVCTVGDGQLYVMGGWDAHDYMDAVRFVTAPTWPPSSQMKTLALPPQTTSASAHAHWHMMLAIHRGPEGKEGRCGCFKQSRCSRSAIHLSSSENLGGFHHLAGQMAAGFE